MTRIFRFYPLSIITVIAIIYLSLFNPTSIGLDKIHIWDKAVHAIMYFGFTIVFWLEYLINNSKLTAKAVLLLMIPLPIIIGGSLEIIQEHFTGIRSGDWKDFLANLVGVMAGAVIGLLIERPIIRRLLPSK